MRRFIGNCRECGRRAGLSENKFCADCFDNQHSKYATRKRYTRIGIKMALMLFVWNALYADACWLGQHVNNQYGSVLIFLALAGALALTFATLFSQE